MRFYVACAGVALVVFGLSGLLPDTWSVGYAVGCCATLSIVALDKIL